MLTKFKKSFTVALAAVMCASSVCASAATWQIKDYDTNIIYPYGFNPMVEIVYEEVDDAGRFTGRMARENVGEWKAQPATGNPLYSTTYVKPSDIGLKPYADVELKNKWFDVRYPNCEYAGIYADGFYLGKNAPTGRKGTQGYVQYKDVDFMWEVAFPYAIHSITKARLNIGGVAQWYGSPEEGYPTQFTGRYANVEVKAAPYGFGEYKVTGDNQVEVAVGYANYRKAYANYKNADILGKIAGSTITPEMLAPKTAATNAGRIMIPWAPVINIPRSYDISLVGPAFDAEGNQIPAGKTVVGSNYNDLRLADFGVKDLITTVRDGYTGDIAYCEISYTDGGYELESPHNIYKYLTIDGVVMDGSYIGKFGGVDYWRPCIAVYTGAVANLY